MNAPDLTQLPPPEVVETLDFETILQVHRADLLARYPEAAAVIDLESEPLNKLLQAHAYRELLYRQRVNEAARAHLLAFATGADLDHKAAFYGLTRLAGESDERLRARVQLRIKSLAGNGTREAYELTAMTASQNVRDARATQPFPGRVHLLLWCHDAAQAEATLATVLAAPGCACHGGTGVRPRHQHHRRHRARGRRAGRPGPAPGGHARGRPGRLRPPGPRRATFVDNRAPAHRPGGGRAVPRPRSAGRVHAPG